MQGFLNCKQNTNHKRTTGALFLYPKQKGNESVQKEEYRAYLENQMKQLKNDGEVFQEINNANPFELIQLMNYLMKELYMLDNEK